MKVHCNIVRDLLPLYHDGACSAESRELVEQHLKICPDCKRELLVMDDVFLPLQTHPTDIDIVATASNAWKKSKRISCAKGIALTLLVIFLVFAIFIFPYTKQGMFYTVNLWNRQLSTFAESRLAQQANGSEVCWGFRISSYPDSNCIFFEQTGSRYTGVIFSADNVPVGFQGTFAEFEKHGDGWLWKDANSDNWMYVEQITEQWYWYEMHF